MYAGRVACCPLVSHVVCTARPVNVRKTALRAILRLQKRRDRQTDGRRTVTLRLPLDAATAGQRHKVGPFTLQSIQTYYKGWGGKRDSAGEGGN